MTLTMSVRCHTGGALSTKSGDLVDPTGRGHRPTHPPVHSTKQLLRTCYLRGGGGGLISVKQAAGASGKGLRCRNTSLPGFGVVGPQLSLRHSLRYCRLGPKDDC